MATLISLGYVLSTELISDTFFDLQDPKQRVLHSLAKCLVHEVGVVDLDDAFIFLKQALLP